MIRVFLLFALCLYSCFIFGQSRELEATRTVQPIRIDGQLSEGVWKTAATAGHFTQYFPNPGHSASAATEVKIVYDDAAVYIGAVLHDDPSEIRRQFTARDGEQQADVDHFSVFFDTYHDQQNGFQFLVTSQNVQTDARLSAAYTGILDNVGDRSWDAVWQSKTAITPDGWVVEMRIPYISLRFSASEVQRWGLQFMRFIRRNSESDFWSPVKPEQSGLVNQFGALSNLTSIQPPLRLSLSPYLSGGVRKHPKGAPQGTEWLRNGGMDVKWGLNESFTLDATLVPDFGQVISDNVINNLTPFEVQFQENRPFFTEGTELFNKAGLFYSRRIGSTPGGYGDVAAFASGNQEWKVEQNPGVTQLYNALKFSGRTRKKLGIGVFNAVTAPMQARLNNGFKDTTIQTEPLTNYNIVVLDQAFKGRSNITFTNTSVLRSGTARDANVTGLDFSFFDKTNTYILTGAGRYSKVFGQTPYNGFISTIYDTVHRADGVWKKPYDGYNARLRFGKVSGRWHYNVQARMLSQQYDPNDLGYLNTANLVNYIGDISYNQYEGTRNLINYSYRLTADYSYLYQPYKRAGMQLSLTGFWLFKNMWDVRVTLGGEPIWKHDYFELRTPGRFVQMPAYGFVNIGGSTDSRKKLYVDYEYVFAEAAMPNNPYYSLNTGVRYRFSNRLSLKLEANRQHDRGQVGYAFLRETNGEPIIGLREVKDVTMLLSGIYNFTPRMNLTLRARHYWSSVHYQSFRDVAADGRYVYRAYIPNQGYDFNVFNVDGFYTWDFKPGSRIVAGFKNWLGADHNIAPHNITGKGYGNNLANTLRMPHGNEVTLRVIFFIDYNQVRRR
ncbi:DUF5916 domain-containing protein, partial [Cnuella takakiae]